MWSESQSGYRGRDRPRNVLVAWDAVALAWRGGTRGSSRTRGLGPDKKVKLILVYPMTTGRNFDEVLRVLDSLQLTAKHRVSTPVNWQRGEDVIIAGSVSNDEARQIYPEGWAEPKPYIRIVPAPQ